MSGDVEKRKALVVRTWNAAELLRPVVQDDVMVVHVAEAIGGRQFDLVVILGWRDFDRRDREWVADRVHCRLSPAGKLFHV